MNILFVFTGGTIGSTEGESNVDVNPNGSFEIIKQYQELYGCEEQFTPIQPYNILSENITPKNWTTLLQTILMKCKENPGTFDGVILAHGSDTLSYTSAMCAYVLHGLSIPVILTAANYPLSDHRSNGLANVHSAVSMIKDRMVKKGVFVTYQDENKENQVYLATRINEADVYRGQFTSFGYYPYGRVVDGKFSRNSANDTPTIEEVNQTKLVITEHPLTFHKEVLLLSSYPGMNWDAIRLTPSIGAVLVTLYHSSTGCVEGTNTTMQKFFQRCHQKGVPTFLCSMHGTNAKPYASTEVLLQAGAKPLFVMSKESAYAKILIAINDPSGASLEALDQNWFWESIH